jgi:hypothetical protein
VGSFRDEFVSAWYSVEEFSRRIYRRVQGSGDFSELIFVRGTCNGA